MIAITPKGIGKKVNMMKRLIFVLLLLTSFNTFAACLTELAATTSATQSKQFLVDGNRTVTIVFHAAAGLSATEHGDIQISHDDGTTWQDMFANGSQLRLNSTNNVVTIYGPGLFRVDKDTTTNATAVFRCARGYL